MSYYDYYSERFDDFPYIVIGEGNAQSRYPSHDINGRLNMVDFTLQRVIVHELYHVALGHANGQHKTEAQRQANERETVRHTNAYMAKYYGEEPRGDYYDHRHDKVGTPEFDYDETTFIYYQPPITMRDRMNDVWVSFFGEDPEPIPGQYIDPVGDFFETSTNAIEEAMAATPDWRASEELIGVLKTRKERMDVLSQDFEPDNVIDPTCKNLDILTGTSIANLRILEELEQHSSGFKNMPSTRAQFLDAVIDEGQATIEEAIAGSHCDMGISEDIQAALN